MSSSRLGWLSRLALLLCALLGATPALAAAEDPDLIPVPTPPDVISELDGFLSQLLRDNADVVTAQLEIERVRGVARQALAALLPSLSASGTLQYIQPSGGGVALPSGTGSTGGTTTGTSGLVVTSTPVYATAGLSLSQSLVAPRSWYALGTNQRSIASARASAEDRQRTTLLAAAGDLLSVLSAASAAEVSRVGLRAALDVMNMTARKLELGSATRLDLVRTQQDVESARATVISANEALRKTREALGLVLGQSRAFGLSPALTVESIEAALERRCQPLAPARRPDVEAASLDVEIAQRTARDSQLAYLPSLSLSATVSASTVAQLSGANWSANLLLALAVPIWDGGAREGVSRAARASLQEKRAQLGAVERSAVVQSAQARRGIAVAEEAEAVAQRALRLSEERARLTRSAFQSGTGTSFDLVDAARKAREDELNQVAKKYARVRARVEALLASASCQR